MDDVVHRLLLYTINNGVLTTFASLLAMVFVCFLDFTFGNVMLKRLDKAAAMPHNFIFLSLHFIIAKCESHLSTVDILLTVKSAGYINSLLTTLNSRDVIKRRNDSNGMPIHISVDGPESTPRFRRQTGVSVFETPLKQPPHISFRRV